MAELGKLQVGVRVELIRRPEVLDALFEYIDARIDEKIERAFDRECWSEHCRASDLKAELSELLRPEK